MDKKAAAEDLVQVVEIRHSTGSDATLVRDLQQLVNQARKAEQKVKRLVGEKATKASQWCQYERDIKEAFLKERQRHLDAVAHLEEEIAKALSAQDDARARVRAAAAGGDQAAPAPAEASAGSVEDSWEAQVAAWEAEGQPNDAAFGAVLQRALQGATPAPATPCVHGPISTPTPHAAVPRSPLPQAASTAPAPQGLAGSSRLQPFPPPRHAPLVVTPPAATDPYLHPAAVLTPPGPGGGSGGKHRISHARIGVKDAAKPNGPLHVRSTSPVDRSQILASKRAQSMALLGQGTPAQPLATAGAFFLDDDQDVTVTEVPPRPPGLDFLE